MLAAPSAAHSAMFSTSAASSAAGVTPPESMRTMLVRAQGHVKPQTDIYGFELNIHQGMARDEVLELEKVRVPRQWRHTPTHATTKSLHASRSQSILPAKSYDIDGDGIVGVVDYRIAARYDDDGNRYLDPAERSNAIRTHCGKLSNSLSEAEIGGK